MVLPIPHLPAAQRRAEAVKDSIARSFLIAQTVEPFASKDGCTTRRVDSSSGTKLEYFAVSAANSLPAMLRLCDRIFQSGRLPRVTFDVLVEAQRASTQYRYGGKVNYAQNLMLFPLIMAQCLVCMHGDDVTNIDTLTIEASAAIRMTGVEDVAYFQSFVDISRQQSEQHHARQGTKRVQLFPQFLSYNNVFDALGEPGYRNMIMSSEIRGAYPVSRECASELINHNGVGVIRKSEDIYPTLRAELGRHDIAADVLVVALYLALISRPCDILFV